METTYITPPVSRPPTPGRIEPLLCTDKRSKETSKETGRVKRQRPVKRKRGTPEDLQRFLASQRDMSVVAQPPRAFQQVHNNPSTGTSQPSARVSPEGSKLTVQDPSANQLAARQFAVPRSHHQPTITKSVIVQRQQPQPAYSDVVTKKAVMPSSLQMREKPKTAKPRLTNPYLATSKDSGAQNKLAGKASHSSIVPYKRFVDPPPPLQLSSVDHSFMTGKFRFGDDGLEYTAKKRKLYRDSFNTPGTSPGHAMNNSQQPLIQRRHTPEDRDERTFCELEQSYATKVDSWLRWVLKEAGPASNCTTYNYFRRELINLPTRRAVDWERATQNDAEVKKHCIIRLHELIHAVLTRIRNDYDDAREWDDNAVNSELTKADNDDPTSRFRCSIDGPDVWKGLPKFWCMLNGPQGASVREYWLPIMQMHYGIDRVVLTCPLLFNGLHGRD